MAAKTAQIDYPFHAGSFGGGSKVSCCTTVPFRKSLLTAGHRMDQIVSDINAVECSRKGFGQECIRPDKTQSSPRLAPEPGRVANQAGNLMTLCQQQRRQQPTYITGRASDQDVHTPRALTCST